MSNLTGCSAPEPELAVDHDAAADAGTPPDANKRGERTSGAQLELAEHGHLDVVVEPDRCVDGIRERRGEGERPLPVREVPGVGDRPGLLVDCSGRSHAGAGELLHRHAARLGRFLDRRRDRGGDVGGPALGWRRMASLADHGVVGADHHGLDLRGSEVDAGPERAHPRPSSA